MFNKLNRLAKTKDVKAAFAQGRSFFNSFFALKFVKKTGVSRFTVVVSTKVSKKAVARNRLKRILREILRKNIPALPSGDYAVVVRPKSAGTNEKELLQSFIELLNKIR
jgi:ribonuclease P protein component